MTYCEDTDFTVYDGRHHVLGASMLAAVDAAARRWMHVAQDAVFALRRAKFVEKAQLNGQIVLQPAGEGAALNGLVIAEFDATLADRKLAAWVIADPDRAVQRKAISSHAISNIHPGPGMGGTCQLQAKGREAVLLSLVDACKHVQLANSFPDRAMVVELLFIEVLNIASDLDQLDGPLSIETIGQREAFGRVVSLSRLTWQNTDGRQGTCRMSLSFAAKQSTGGSAEGTA